MPPVQLTDALWQCLCPSFSRVAIRTIRQPVRVLQQSLRQQHAVSLTLAASSKSRTTCRHYHDEARRRPTETTVPTDEASELPRGDQEARSRATEDGAWQRKTGEPRTQWRSLRSQLRTGREKHWHREWQKMGKQYLHQELEAKAQQGDKTLVELIVNILVLERHESLDIRHYHALMLANCSTDLGSAGAIENLLDSMHNDNIPADAEVFHAALKVLAIHPDYLLRQKILSLLEQYWFPLTHSGWSHVIVGLFRDRQYEMGLLKLREMRELSFTPEPWLLHFLITSLCSISGYPEALTLLQLRNQYPAPISSALWAHTLSSAASNYHYPLTKYVWQRAVSTQYLNPSSGVCTDVLAVAARHGDFNLATDVLRVLGGRSSPIRAEHYEALYESALAARDMPTALSVLAIMSDTPTPPTESGLSAFYTYLLAEERRPRAALAVLRAQREEGRRVSVVVVNTILDVLGHFNALGEALRLYARLKSLVPEGPTTNTFNALLRGCYKAAAKDKAMFIAAEMRELGITPDSLTYDRLILVCCKGSGVEDVEDGYRYWEEMCGRGWWPRFGTVFQLVQGLTKGRDKRVWRVLQENARRGGDSLVMRRWVNEAWPAMGERMQEEEEFLGEDEMQTEVEVENEQEEEFKRRVDKSRGRGGKEMSEAEFKEWDPLM